MSTKNKSAKLSAKQRDLIAGAAMVGYQTANAFEAGVALARSIGAHKQALADAGVRYQAGYVARSLFSLPAYAKRWGNMTDAQRIEAAAEIMARPTPDSTKPNRRSEVEHKACRAASVSWHGCKSKAGVITVKPRKPRPASNKPDAKPVPVDLVKASPTLKTKGAVNDHFATAVAALLATVNKNAKLIDPRLSTAVADFKAAVDAALKPAA